MDLPNSKAAIAKKPTLLIKLSGGCLHDQHNSQLYDHQQLQQLCAQIAQLQQHYQLGIVIGGGNLWRGKSNYLTNLSAPTSDYVGMLATIINGLVLRDYLLTHQVQATCFSAFACNHLVEEFNLMKVKQALHNHQVVIFVGGTGLPFVSTDTAAAIRALEIGAEVILMGKDHVKGVYSADPKTNPNAHFYPQLDYQTAIKNDLGFMDQAALSLCSKHQLKIIVFNQAIQHAFIKALNGEIERTMIQ